MGKIKTYPPVKLIAAIAISEVSLWSRCKTQLEALYSPIDLQMDWYDFIHTNYYASEMGKSLKKRMVAFQDLVLAERLPDIKLTTNQLEDGYLENGRRRINIDPGYINAPKLVLATTKDFAHRIYLNKGIFGDVHLTFIKGEWRVQDWTYPDYRDRAVLDFFNQVREVYLQQLADEVF